VRQIAEAERLRSHSPRRSRKSGPKRSEEAQGRKKPGDIRSDFVLVPAHHVHDAFLSRREPVARLHAVAVLVHLRVRRDQKPNVDESPLHCHGVATGIVVLRKCPEILRIGLPQLR
jgi:hypothetical protein